MKNTLKFAAVLAALTTIAGAPAANASPLLTFEGSTFLSLSDYVAGQAFTLAIQPLAVIDVGASKVTIGGFGVYGHADADGSLKWVLFEGNNLIWQSTAQAVNTLTSGATWYSSPSISQELNAGHQYAMGVVATNNFSWGWTDDGAQPVLGSGLSMPVAFAQPDVTLSGLGGSFTENGVQRDPNQDFPDYAQVSLAVWTPGSAGPAPPVPEPAEWSMLLAGLLVVAFVANRQRKTTA